MAAAYCSPAVACFRAKYDGGFRILTLVGPNTVPSTVRDTVRTPYEHRTRRTERPPLSRRASKPTRLMEPQGCFVRETLAGAKRPISFTGSFRCVCLVVRFDIFLVSLAYRTRPISRPIFLAPQAAWFRCAGFVRKLVSTRQPRRRTKHARAALQGEPLATSERLCWPARADMRPQLSP
jgi:hypothetical protein